MVSPFHSCIVASELHGYPGFVKRVPGMLCMMLVCLSGLAGPLAAETPERTKKALYIGVDGIRFDALVAANTPHMDSLMERGGFAGNCLIMGPRFRGNDTSSGPGWSSILTGVWADRHGVLNNNFQSRNYDEFPHYFVLLKRQFPESRTASYVTWKPIDDYLVREADVQEGFFEGETDYAKWDGQAADAAVKGLADPKLDCVFVYFGHTDEAGHAHGFHPSVEEYRAAIETVDGYVGRLVEAVQARETYDREDWLIVMTSDHGGQGTGHGGGQNDPEVLNTFLIVSGDSVRRGRFEEQTYIVDAPVTVLVHLGVELDPEWKLDGQPRGLKE